MDLLIAENQTVFPYLYRHHTGDWTAMSCESHCENLDALEFGERILSAYRCGTETLWIITEWDRSVTTVLLPDEY